MPGRYRPTPPAPGHRPARAARFAAGRCPAPACGEPFVIDRQEQPWARARTCSSECARRLGHRNRRPDNRHREFVEGYRLQRDTDVQHREVMAADEDLVPVTLRAWMETYEWQQEAA